MSRFAVWAKVAFHRPPIWSSEQRFARSQVHSGETASLWAGRQSSVVAVGRQQGWAGPWGNGQGPDNLTVNSRSPHPGGRSLPVAMQTGACLCGATLLTAAAVNMTGRAAQSCLGPRCAI